MIKAYFIKRIVSPNVTDTDFRLYRLGSGEYITTYLHRIGSKPVVTVRWADRRGGFIDNNSKDSLILWAEGVSDPTEAMRQAGYDVIL